MTESATRQRLRALLEAAANAHHDIEEGPDHDWAPWYAEYLYEDVVALTVSEPSLDTLTSWLREADSRHSGEGLDGAWPDRYATWIVEWDQRAAAP